MNSKLLNVTEFARLLGISRGSVLYAIDKGRLSITQVDGRKMIDSVEGLAEWEANTNKTASIKGKKGKGAKKKKAVNKKSKSKEPTPVKWSPPPKVDADGEVTLSEAERREKLWRSELSKLKFEKEAGNLIEKNLVQRRAFECARKTRDAIMTVPARIGHELAAETDPHKVELLLRKHLEKALSKLITEETTNGKN